MVAAQKLKPKLFYSILKFKYGLGRKSLIAAAFRTDQGENPSIGKYLSQTFKA